jgi:hypothetical protein
VPIQPTKSSVSEFLIFETVSGNDAYPSNGRDRRGGITNGRSQIWLPFLDTYRTICLAPQPEFRRLLEQARDLPIAA